VFVYISKARKNTTILVQTNNHICTIRLTITVFIVSTTYKKG